MKTQDFKKVKQVTRQARRLDHPSGLRDKMMMV